jgi:hypothetical protein
VVWSIPREEGWSDLEWQLRNWGYFTWLSGDHIVEQHVHNLDVANWVLGEHPVRATALGGRQARFGEVTGNIYDHFAVEYEYASGIRMYSQCRQMDNCENRVEEIVEGSQGTAKVEGMIRGLDGKVVWRFRDRDAPNPYEQEHADLMDSIRAGQPLNEARAFAETTLTGIMGRESAYSGKSITWTRPSPRRATTGFPATPSARSLSLRSRYRAGTSSSETAPGPEATTRAIYTLARRRLRVELSAHPRGHAQRLWKRPHAQARSICKPNR